MANVEHIPQPGLGRLILGFVMAPLSATLALVLLSRIGSPPYLGSFSLALTSFLIALVIAASCTIVLGIPVYLLLRRRVSPTLPRIALAGSLLGLAAYLFVSGPVLWIRISEIWDQLPPGTMIAELRSSALTMVSGLIGGIIFWVCTVWQSRNFAKPVSS